MSRGEGVTGNRRCVSQGCGQRFPGGRTTAAPRGVAAHSDGPRRRRAPERPLRHGDRLSQRLARRSQRTAPLRGLVSLQRPRFHLHFTPTYSSWIDQVERWFAELTRKQLRRGVHRSTRALKDRIRLHLATYNGDPDTFVWVLTADGDPGRHRALLPTNLRYGTPRRGRALGRSGMPRGTAHDQRRREPPMTVRTMTRRITAPTKAMTISVMVE